MTYQGDCSAALCEWIAGANLRDESLPFRLFIDPPYTGLSK